MLLDIGKILLEPQTPVPLVTFSDVSAADNRTACQPCGIGRYSTMLGATLASEHCLKCPKGRYGLRAIAGHVSECEPCARGSWSNDMERKSPVLLDSLKLKVLQTPVPLVQLLPILCLHRCPLFFLIFLVN